MRRVRLAAAIAAVAVLQIVAGVLLYRARVIDHWPAADAVVFLLPALSVNPHQRNGSRPMRRAGDQPGAPTPRWSNSGNSHILHRPV
jgi:hypothetical protein